MKRRTAFAAAFVAASALSLATPLLAARGPSTPEERAKAVQLTRLLETTPWSEEAGPARQWLLTFLGEAPDITVKRCLSLYGPPPQRQGIPAELLDQHMFSGATYLIEHPDAGAGNTPTFVAALEGALAAYAAGRGHGTYPAVPQLDQLAQMKKDGKLDEWVRAVGRNCR